MTDEHKWSETRLHDGGPCPVDPDAMVRSGRHHPTGLPARAINWSYIIAYQVRIKPEPLVERWAVMDAGEISTLTDRHYAERWAASCGGRAFLMREVRE